MVVYHLIFSVLYRFRDRRDQGTQKRCMIWKTFIFCMFVFFSKYFHMNNATFFQFWDKMGQNTYAPGILLCLAPLWPADYCVQHETVIAKYRVNTKLFIGWNISMSTCCRGILLHLRYTPLYLVSRAKKPRESLSTSFILSWLCLLSMSSQERCN